LESVSASFSVAFSFVFANGAELKTGWKTRLKTGWRLENDTGNMFRFFFCIFFKFEKKKEKKRFFFCFFFGLPVCFSVFFRGIFLTFEM